MNPEILGGRVGAPEEKEEGTPPTPLEAEPLTGPEEPEEPDKGSKVVYMPGAKEKLKERQKRGEKPSGDPESVLKKVSAYHKIRFSIAGEAGWREAEVLGWLGWEDKNHLKLALIDNGQKTGRVITLDKANISAVDIIEGAYGS